MVRKDPSGTLRATVTMRVEQVTQAEGEVLHEEIEKQKEIIKQFSVEMENNKSVVRQAEQTLNEMVAILGAIKEGIANA